MTAAISTIEGIYPQTTQVLAAWNTGFDLLHLAVISGAAVVIWALVTWLEQIRVQHQQNAATPRALFATLCRAHHLKRQERRLLAKAIGDIPAAHRCDVFVDPSILKRLAEVAGPDALAYRELLERLFGSKIASG